MKTYIKTILEKRKNLPDNEFFNFSEEICNKLFSLKEYQESKNILVFYPYRGEVDVLPVALKALKTGKKVFFPKVTGETTMDFVKIADLNDFEEGYKGIKEPVGETVFDVKNKEKTIMILPGSVFDYFGNRCGYGKGYYDRYLSLCQESLLKIGVCFSLQMVDKMIDVKATDVPMDYVINEERIIRRDK